MTLPRAAPADVEAELRRAVAAGDEAFNAARWRRWSIDVSVQLLKELVTTAHAPCGVQIHGATIDGVLNLRDGRGDSGSACNALILHECVLGPDHAPLGTPGIDASHCHLRRLSLLGCRVDGVDLTGAVIDGDLELDEIGPRADGDGRQACWVRARRVRVGGSVTARRATISLPWPPGSDWGDAAEELDRGWLNIPAPYGLDLTGAEITGSLVLSPRFTSRAGVSVSGASIGGRLDASGATIEAAGIHDSDEALLAQLVRIQGPVFLCRDDANKFEARGTVDFAGAQIGGRLTIEGADVTVEDAPSDSPWPTYALGLYGASLTAGLVLWDSNVRTVDLRSATINGSTNIFAPIQAPIERVDATTLRVVGDLELSGFASGADLSGSTIDGQLVLGTARTVDGRLVIGDDDPFTLTSVNGSHPALKLADARVGRSLRVVAVDSRIRVKHDGTRRPFRIRTCQLACYEDWVLAEALFKPTSSSGPAILSFLYTPRGEDGGGVVVLDGSSYPIHSLSTDLQLETPRQLVDYLSFFCSYVWGENGAFTIVPDSVSTPEYEDGGWTATAKVTYGSDLFDADFRIETSGTVEMVDDHPRNERPPEVRTPLYATPVRQFEDPHPSPSLTTFVIPDWPDTVPPLGSGTSWVELNQDDDDYAKVWSALRQQQMNTLEPFEPATSEPWPAGWRRPQIDLAGLTVASLDDAHGENWFKCPDGAQRQARTNRHRHDSVVQLILSGFEYERIADDVGIRQPQPMRSGRGRRDFEDSSDESDTSSGSRLGRNLFSLLRNAALRCVRYVQNIALDIRRRLSGDDARLAQADTQDTAKDHRLRWLEAQYSDDPPPAAEYTPQPYQQLARVWRAAGNFGDADEISYQKLRLEKVELGLDRRSQPETHTMRWVLAAIAVSLVVAVVVSTTTATVVLVALAGLILTRRRFPLQAVVFDHWCKQRLWEIFVQVPFGFGLKPRRAAFWFLVFWAAGILVVAWKEDLLVLDTSAVGTVVAEDQISGGERVVVPVEPNVPRGSTEIHCNDQINKIIYPLDVAIPLIDLREEARCHFSVDAGAWGVAKSLYAVLGWVMVSGLIITMSGVVRRRIES